MNVAIIKYNAGNIFSIDYALRRLGIEPVITADKELIRKADKVIFPGVGEAKNTMEYLQEHQLDRPVRHEDKVPHMGWNTIQCTDKLLFNGFEQEEFVYFVHSYYVPLNDFTAARTDYILPFSAALHKDNFYATQFHPEKSGKTGERILQNFLNIAY